MGRDALRPWYRWNPADFRSDPAVYAMTVEQRWRYRDALDSSWLSKTPGIAQEDVWRGWMGYSAPEWENARTGFLGAFLIDGSVWTQRRMVAEAEHAMARSRDSTVRSANQHRVHGRFTVKPTVDTEVVTVDVDVDEDRESLETANAVSCPTEPVGRNGHVKHRREESLEAREWREAFQLFWEEYPRHEKRKDAERAWGAVVLKGQRGMDAVIGGLRRWGKSKQWRDPQYVPLAATWLRAEQWNDEVGADAE